jgi:hypothetical protein
VVLVLKNFGSLVISTISLSSRYITSFVLFRNACMSDAMNISEKPLFFLIPTISGEPFLNAKIFSSFESRTKKAFLPSSEFPEFMIACFRVEPFLRCSSIRCGIISVSVSLVKMCPLFVSILFSSWKFSTIPLCTTAILFWQSK